MGASAYERRRCGLRRIRPSATSHLGVARRSPGRRSCTAVLAAERQVDPHERLALLLDQVRVGEDVPHEVVVAALVLEDPGPHVERLGRDPQGLRDLLEDLRRRLAQPALDLAQVRVRDARDLRQPCAARAGPCCVAGG